MKISELQPGEYFIFNGHKYKRLKKIPNHKDAWDCMDTDNRHRPFKGELEIKPYQERLTVSYSGNIKEVEE